jgi:hypothetical protein
MVVAVGDRRMLVELPPVMREHMLSNMRAHLAAITEIQQALSEGAFDRAAEVAERRLGMSSLESHGAAHMAGFVPPEMQQVGTAMHRAASELGVIAQEAAADGDLRRAMGAPAQVTQQCVA